MKPALAIVLVFTGFSCVPTPVRDPRETSNIEASSSHGWLRILSPKPADFTPSKTVVLKAALRLKDSSIDRVYVNDTSVPIRKNTLNVPVELESCEGIQSIEVWVPDTDLHTNVDFYCDDIKPKIEFNASYEAGSGFIQGDRLTITGHVEEEFLHHLWITDPTDPSLSGKYVTVNGPEGQFTLNEAAYPGAHRRRLCAVDRAGHMTCKRLAFIVGDFVNTQDGGTVPQAVAISLGQGAVNAVSSHVKNVISAQDFSGKLLSLNPLALHYGNNGALWYAIYATRYEHGAVNFEAYLQNGVIYLRASVAQNRISFAFNSDVVPSATGNIYVPEVRAEFYARPYVLNGQPQVELSTPVVTICPNLNDCVLSMSNEFYHQVAQAPVIRQIVRDKAQDTLQTELHRQAQTELQKALEIELTKDITVAGVSARVHGALERVQVSSSSIQIIGNVGIKPLHPVMTGPGTVINRRRHAAPLTLPGGNVMAAVSTDLINAGLYTAWSAGFFNQQLIRPDFGGDELTVGELSSLLPVPPEADPHALVRFEVTSPLPPTVYDVAVGSVGMLVPDMRVKAISQQNPDLLLFELSLALRAHVNILGDAKSVRIRPLFFTLVADPTSAAESFPTGETLDEIFTSLFKEDLYTLLDTIGPIPIPALPPFHIDQIEPVLAPDYFAYQGNLYYSP